MLFSAAAAAGIIAYANLVTCSPSVQLNGTSVVGQSFPELDQEFFGGELGYSQVQVRSFILHCSLKAFRLRNRPSVTCVSLRLN